MSHLSGVSKNVVLTNSGCPPSAICFFNPTNGNPPYTSTFTVITNSTTPTGSYLINVTGTGDGKIRSAIYTLTVNSP